MSTCYLSRDSEDILNSVVKVNAIKSSKNSPKLATQHSNLSPNVCYEKFVTHLLLYTAANV